MVRQACGRIAGLVLLDTSARPETLEQTVRRTAQIDMARSGRFDAISEQMFAVLSRPAGLGDARMRQIIRAMAADTGPDAFIRQQTAIMGRADSRPTLAAIGCPTLVVAGDEDTLTPPDLAVEIAQGIPHARLEVVAECGHLSTLDQPERINALLDSWLRTLP